MGDSKIFIKVKLDEDIRRFSVPTGITYEELRRLVCRHFVIAPVNVQLKYIDDEEELITLGSDLELQEAKRLQPTVLRLNIYNAKVLLEQPQTTALLDVTFVQDVTVPDNARVYAGLPFQKVWRVKNSGAAPWPKGVVLKMVDPKDDQLLVRTAGAVCRPVAPGEEVEVIVELQAPWRAGRCVQYWRLFTEAGEAFGRRLWIDVDVTIPPPSLEDSTETLTKLGSGEERGCLEEEEGEVRQALHLAEERKEEEAKRLRVAAEEAAVAEQHKQTQTEELQRKREELAMKAEQEEKIRGEAAAAAAAAAEERRQKEEAAAVAEERRQKEEAAAAEERRQKEEAAAAAEALKKRHEEEKAWQLFNKYPGQLTALREMGFTNIEHNVCLLDRNKGSLDLALEALLSGN